MDSVAVVTLNWNSYATTKRLLDSMFVSPGLDNADSVDVIVVDNGSSDGSPARLREEYGSKVALIANDRNLGFSAGCNVGIREGLSRGANAILLLNNDCVTLDASFISIGLRRLQDYNGECIIGGKIYWWPSASQLWSTGGYVRTLGAEVHIGLGQEDVGQYDEPDDRSFVSGACMFIGRPVIEKLGFLPECYFFGKEEWDYCYSARAQGIPVKFEPALRVWHDASRGHSWSDPVYVYNGALSHILFRRRNHGALRFWAWFSCYSVAATAGLRIRYRLRRDRFNPDVPFPLLAFALRRAIQMSWRKAAITAEDLEDFREAVAKYARHSGC